MKGTEERLSLRDAADALGISEVTARRWIKSGKLKAYQPGRKYLIPASAVEELLAADSPEDAQKWERVLAGVQERQRDIEVRVEEWEQNLVGEVDPYDVKRLLDEAKDCEATLLLAMPGSQSQGPDKIAVNPFALDLDQWEEFVDTVRFYKHVVERLVEVGLVEVRERSGHKAEPVPVGIGA